MDYKKISKAAEQLRKSAEQLDQFHAKAKPTRSGKLSKRDAERLARLEKQFAAADDAVRSMPGAAAKPEKQRAQKQAAEKKAEEAEPAARFDFDGFFTEVAEGFINAQSKLDVASAEYLKQVSEKPHVLPSVFRMPKLDANMKFALEKQTGKGIQLLFFKNESTTTNLNEQSVHFEIVAAPPPAGVSISPVVVAPLLSKTGRAALFQSIQDYLLPAPNNTPAKTDTALDRKNLVASPDNVIVIAVNDRSFLLTVADGKASGNIGVWYFETGATPFLSVLRKFGLNTDLNIAQVADFIFKLGTAQKEFLSKLS
jgi:hypothetical protein